MCYLWQPDVLLLHVASDALIALAYFSIPFTLLYFALRRKDLRFTGILVCFAAFIVACGASHVMDIVTVWIPDYWASGLVKAVTACASVPTAFLLMKLVPVALELPSPAALQTANRELAREIEERKQAERLVRDANDSLEARVAERTAQLADLNRTLQQEIRERRQSEELLAVTLKSITSGVIAADLEGVVTFMNESAGRIVGVEPAAACGRPLSSIFAVTDPETGAPLADLVSTIVRDGAIAPPTSDVVLAAARPGVTMLDLRGAPIRAEGAVARGVVLSFRDVTERRRIQTELRAANLALEQRVALRTSELKEREAMLQEIHHRVKNNLQVVSSLINMQIRTLSDQPTRRALQECRSRIETMAQIHELLYQARDYARVPLAKYAKEVALRVLSASGLAPDLISITFHLDDVYIPVAKAIPCGLILNELITNSLKHAFPGEVAGEIKVQIQRHEASQISLVVSDTGVGLPAGYAPQASKSLGMQLVATLVGQLGADLSIGPGPGAAFRMTFSAE